MMSGGNPRAHPSPMDVLRHAIGVVTQLGKEAAAELCDRIEAVVRAYDEANTLDDWLAADLAEAELGDWAVGVFTEDGTVGVDLGLPNPYADALRFPSIAGEPPAPAREQPRPASPVSYALPARRYERAMDRLFADSRSPEAHAEMDAASDAMRMPPSIFEAPIVAARAKAHARLGLEREERQRELRALLEAQFGES